MAMMEQDATGTYFAQTYQLCTAIALLGIHYSYIKLFKPREGLGSKPCGHSPLDSKTCCPPSGVSA